ncbi:hypothetical protein ABVT39_004329 [Epinephelus coioides]
MQEDEYVILQLMPVTQTSDSQPSHSAPVSQHENELQSIPSEPSVSSLQPLDQQVIHQEIQVPQAAATQQAAQPPKTPSPPQGPPNKKAKKPRTPSDDFEHSVMSTLNKEHDTEELFLQSLAPMLKCLSPKSRGETKFGILTLLHKAQFK